MRKKKKNLNFYIGLAITGLMLLMILIGVFYTPYDPETMNAAVKNTGMSLSHPFGCDNFGRDILSRIMVGSRTTVLVGLATVAIGTFFGIIIGAFTGYYGGVVDEVLMRIMDALLAFPSILLALVIIGLFSPSTWNLIMALGIAFVPSFARIVRGEFLRQKNLDYVVAAKLNGAGDLRIIFVHILPNTVRVLSSSVLIGFNNAVLAEAGMSFLGIGVMPPDPSLGRMLSEAQSYIFSNPGFAIFPGAVLILIILGISLIGSCLE